MTNSKFNKDPVSLLSRRSFVTSFAPLYVPSAPTREARSGSVTSSAPSHHSATASEDDDDDPAAGYVSLNATNLSSSGPEVVEFNRIEGIEYDGEESGERGRERRRKRRFVECLEAENVDVG